MANDIPKELGDGGLGDLTGVMGRQGISDLRWLDVDAEEYAKFEALPKQNFDIIPEIQEYLANSPDEKVQELVIQRPITVVNTNPLERPDPPSRASTVENLKNKVATFVVAGLPPTEIGRRLSLEYSPSQIRAASSSIKEILEERGLLGNVYVNASNFPKCHNPKDKSHNFVARHASRAQFVLAKDKCTNCVCNKAGICSSFKKRVVSSVPYDQNTLATHVGTLISEKRLTRGALNDFPRTPDKVKGVLRKAFRNSPIHISTEQPQQSWYQPKVQKSDISESQISDFIARQKVVATRAKMPSPAVMRAILAMSQGGNHEGLRASLDSEVRIVAKEHGILGHTYLDIDALGGPKPTISFIKSRNLFPDFLIARQAYEGSDELTQIVKTYKVYSTIPELDLSNFKNSLRRAVEQGRMDLERARFALDKVQKATSVDWKAVIAQVNLHQPIVSEKAPDYTAPKMSFYHGDTSESQRQVAEMNPEEVRKTISHLMNTGLYGKRLQKAILSRYTKQDLQQVPEVGQLLASEDGVQGFHYVDPTAYSDYGKGCSQGARTLRHNQVSCVKASNKCTGCRLQTAPGHCSKYAKQLIRSVPESARREASQRLALPVIQDIGPVENPVEKYELASTMDIDINGAKSEKFNINFSENNVFD